MDRCSNTYNFDIWVVYYSLILDEETIIVHVIKSKLNEPKPTQMRIWHPQIPLRQPQTPTDISRHHQTPVNSNRHQQTQPGAVSGVWQCLPSEYYPRIMFSHSHCQNIHSQSQNKCLKNFRRVVVVWAYHGGGVAVVMMKVVVSLCQGCSSLGLSWNVVWPSPHAAHQPPGQVRPLMLMIRNYSRNILKYFGLGVPGPLTSIWQCGCKVAHHNVKSTSQKLLNFYFSNSSVIDRSWKGQSRNVLHGPATRSGSAVGVQRKGKNKEKWGGFTAKHSKYFAHLTAE